MQESGQACVVPAVAPSATACIRSLGRRGIRTIAVSETETAPGFSSRYCDEAHVIPDPATDFLGYKDALLALAGRPDVEAIAPIREEDVWALSAYRSAFGEHVRPLWPALETLRSVYDRMRLVEIANAAGVAVPETRPLDEVDNWDRERIVKPRYAILTNEYVDGVSPTEIAHPGSVRFIEPGSEPDRETLREEMGHVPIAQEYVPGEEYALWALYDRGERVATCQKRQIRGYSYAGNTSVARRTTTIPDLEAAGRAVLDALDWHGLASVQFVRNEDTGEFTLLEVNPRFWVSLSCPIRAGVDFAYYYWLLARGESVRPALTYEDGVTTHLLRGEALYVLSVLREENPLIEPPSLSTAARAVAASILRQPNFEYLSADDPRPFARDVRNTASELLSYAPDAPILQRETTADAPDEPEPQRVHR